jgi:ABC-type multidrug transport system ATPase subunit
VCFAAVSRGQTHDRVLAEAVDWFTALGLGGERFLTRRCWNLSAGERRLLEVVAALIAPSALAVLDEPTAGLDPDRRATLAALVRTRANRGPVLVASQDTEWLALTAARVTVLRNGPGANAKSQQKNGLTEPCREV